VTGGVDPARLRSGGVAAALLVVLALPACKHKHLPVDTVPELGYPACGDGGQDDGVEVARGRLRAGPASHEQNVVEQFSLRRTPCGYTFRSRQEWPLDISDVEIRYDDTLTPIWAWKRMTLAGSKRADGDADIRRYELRTGDVFIKRRRDATGEVALERLLPGGRMKVPVGARVGAVLAPGRGAVTAWIRRSKLSVGGKVYDLVLDARPMVEKLELGSLERNPDEFEPSLGRSVRVYTFFGQESVFADDDDVVIGDLAGMRPSSVLPTREPEALPTFGGPDPAHSP
jgi:hypothetical protein